MIATGQKLIGVIPYLDIEHMHEFTMCVTFTVVACLYYTCKLTAVTCRCIMHGHSTCGTMNNHNKLVHGPCHKETWSTQTRS